jgi:pilus assembly protein CpaD
MRKHLALFLLPLALGGCPAEMVEHDYAIGHPIAVEEQAAIATFDRPQDDAPLSAFDRGRLARLAGEAVRRGAGTATVTVGAKGGDEAVQRAFADGLAAVLRENGVGAVEVKLVVAGTPAADVAVVRVPVWQARAPECGSYERGVNPDWSNAPNSNWGCAIQRNKALMVQNPADLVHAREASGRDANRSVDVLDKYGRGVHTGSEAEPTAVGKATSTLTGSGR